MNLKSGKQNMIAKIVQELKNHGLRPVLFLLILFFTWIGFGNYTAVVITIVFIVCLFFQDIRKDIFKDRLLFYVLIIFSINNIISGLFSINKFESSILALMWFLVIFIPVSFARISVDMNESFFIEWIVTISFLTSLIILFYLLFSFSKTLLTSGFIIKRHTFYFLGKASTPDTIVMLSGIGYGWIVQKQGKRYKWFGFVYLLLCVVCMVATYDRGGMLAIFVVLIILLGHDYKRLILFFVLIGVILLLSFYLTQFSSLRRFYEFFYAKNVQNALINGQQLATFRGAWGMIKDHWLLGVGTGNFHAFIKKYGTGRWYTYAHNFVLQFWAENGLFGMIFGCSIIGLVVYRWAKSWKLYRYKYIALGVGASFIGMLIGNLTNSTIWMIKIALPFWLLAGVLNAIYYIVKNQTDDFLKNSPMDEL